MSKPARNQIIGDFVLNNEATYAWTVYVYVPNAAGNGKQKLKFKVEFRHVEPERRLEILDDFREKLRQREQLQQQSEGEMSDADVQTLRDVVSFERMLLDEVVVRFLEHVRDKDGNDISKLEGTKDQMLRNAWARDALLATYQTSLQGRAPEGN